MKVLSFQASIKTNTKFLVCKIFFVCYTVAIELAVSLDGVAASLCISFFNSHQVDDLQGSTFITDCPESSKRKVNLNCFLM